MIVSDRETDFLAGSAEMGGRIRAFDWTRTPLGPIDSWPQSLKTSVSLILGSRHPMWIGWGPEMTFLYNDAYLHVLGYAKHPRALGRPAAEVWAEIWDVCGPLANKVFESGEASFVDDVRLFMDRGDFLEETFYSFSYSPIRDESGQVRGLFCPSTDVTPKVVNARRLGTISELSANALIEKTTAGACKTAARTLAKNPDDVPFALLYLADREGRRASLEQAIGTFSSKLPYPQKVDLQGGPEPSPWPILEVFGGAQREIVSVERMEGLPAGVAGRPVFKAVVLPVSSRGEHRPYGVLITGVNPCLPLDPDHLTFFELVAGQVATAIQNARASEEEKRRADMLAEIDRAKTVFFSNVSHEFRTPLTLMLGPIESLLSEQGLQPEQRDQLAIAHRNSLRLLKLVNSLLDFSRIEAGRMKASYAPTDLSAFTAELASNFRSAMEAAGVKLIVDCPPLPEPVYVDQEMWEKIVLNLLSNAFKFTFNGTVTVRIQHADGHALLTVSDTGTGIPESELPHIFDRFHRVEGVKGRTYEGTGIGLALVQELTRLHGGSVSVASRLGEGSTFRISLLFGTGHLAKDRIRTASDARTLPPVLIEAFTDEALGWLNDVGDLATEPVPDQTNLRPVTKARILLADDNADMREHVVRILGEEYEIMTAADGRQAMELVRQKPPALLLSDIMMPGMDGLELLRNIRSDPMLKTLPVIFLSARAGDEMRIEGLEAGADDYLVKPFTAAELRARVGTHLRMALARRSAAEQETRLRADAEAARDQVTRVLESINDGFLALDRDWRITYVNAEAERISGMQREEMLGKNHWELFPEAVGTTVHRELLRSVQENVPVNFENYYAPWKRWFHVRAYPAKDGGVSVFYEDVTARRAAEELIRESDERYRAIVETTPECVKIVAPDGTLLHMNPAGLEMIGANSPEAAVGKNVYELIANEYRDAFREFNERICRGERGSLEFDMLGLQGQLRHMESHAAPFQREDGTMVNLAITRDITDRKRRNMATSLLSAIVDCSDDAIISKDLNGVITSWNKSAERVFGYTATEAVGRTVAELLIPYDRQDEEPDILDRLRRGERVDHFETIRRHKDGTLIDISLTISPVKGADGRIVGASKIARNITDRKRSERAIQDLNAQLSADLRAMTKMQQLSARLVQADDILELLGDVLDAAVEITAADMGDVQLVENGVLRIVCHRGFEAPFLEFFDSIYDGHTACGTALLCGERVIVEDVATSPVFAGTRGRQVMLAAKARAVQSTPLVSRSGEVLGIFSTHYRVPRRPSEREIQLLDILARIAADLIERMRAGKALLASEARFRQLADSMPQMVWAARADGHIDYYNQRWYEFTGFPRDNFDVSWNSILHPDDVNRCQNTWSTAVVTGQPYQMEYRFWDRHENRWRWFMGRALPAHDVQGRIVKWFGTCTDIDEQKRAENDLRSANHDLEQFAYSASHDLQEPLRGIKIYTDLLARKYREKLDEEGVEFMNFVQEGATRMELLVRDLLAYTQVSRPDVLPENADANACLADALANLQGAIVESGASISSDPLPHVRVHGAHLRQLFLNLIGNAIKYRSPERDPEVLVHAEHSDGYWIFSVNDNGIGIPPEYRDRIFGLFKRLHTKEAYSGTGIGLAICKRIVERYNGKIWVESEPGHGSKFLFTLPA